MLQRIRDNEPMSHITIFRALVMAALASTTTLAALAQNDALITKRPSTLRDAPADTAATLANLPAQTPLTRLPVRQGPYVQVRTANGTTGWMHLFDVSSPAEQSSVAATATGALRGLTNFFNRGNAPATNTASTTVGIRGLGAEDIANAQPNPSALAQMEGQRQDASQARRFADSAALQVHAVEPLPVPTPPAPPAGPAGRRLESNN
ncbi:hypothetical protein MCEMIEM13_02198 [Comamonadaceae bacterium]